MTPDEALSRLDSTYHSPLLAIVRAEVERLRQDLAAARARVAELTRANDQLFAHGEKMYADLAAARAALDAATLGTNGMLIRLLTQERDEVREQLAVARELLREIEWDVNGKCPICTGWKMPEGEMRGRHTDNCPLRAALAGNDAKC